ncbi:MULTISPECIES: DMT family transporter [unclassified Leptolyngbya]|uniref:DMT family transporter n=1 Tax=unclassified Leptolyngbya TaxID=2650499 RepID=UPI0016896718|nr:MULTISPECIES: DMT family transporter [unclassified Leptolyngbya]MBD1913370.1 DMT family transporter [Leptolyngbya sp. FACHB-8]MBD2158699.1 DMT family transporter [Leptolyngbya sp. FACHB-16]
MLTLSQKPYYQGLLLLLLTTIIWGTSFPLLKGILADLSPAAIIAMRFSLAAIAVLPGLRQVNPSLLRDGILLGTIYFAECALSLVALEVIPASRSAFIIGLNAFLVPLFGLLLGRRPPSHVLGAAAVAVAGVGMLSWEGGGFNWGDVVTLGCAVAIAVYILLLERIAPRHATLPLVAVQLTVMAVLGTLWALPQLLTQMDAIAHHFGTLLYTGLVITATPIWTQALAQRWVPSYEAALIYTLEPVFATLFAFLMLGEALGPRGLLGGALVIAATLWSQRKPDVN